MERNGSATQAGIGGTGLDWNLLANKVYAERAELCTFYSADVTASHSGLVSHHWR